MKQKPSTPRRAKPATREDTEPDGRVAAGATIAAVVVSVAVALPAQTLWFLDKMVGHRGDGHLNVGVDPQTLVAFACPLLVEGLTWLCAVLYADSVKREAPQRTYRLATFAFSCVAAAINFSHGTTISPVVGVVFAMASLMGVGAWELYMMRSRHIATGMSGDEIKLWALRWRKHPLVMREAATVRATFGLRVPREVAWRIAYVRKVGNPTVPVALTDGLIERLFVRTTSGKKDPETSASEPAEVEVSSGTGGGGVAVAEVVELPVDWAAMSSADAIVERYWPDIVAELGPEESSADAERQFRNDGASTSASTTRTDRQEQAVTRKVPVSKRNSRTSGRARIAPTKAELAGAGNATERLLRYLKRAEATASIAELDRKFIAEKFGVSDRHVRNAIVAHQDQISGSGK